MTSRDGSRPAPWALRASAWGPVVSWLGLITFLSHQPSLPIPGRLPDWLAHGAEYAVLAWLLIRALQVSGRQLTLGLGALLVAGCAVAGALDEFHQSFVPGRDAEPKDVLADTTGAAIATTGALAWRLFRGRKGVAGDTGVEVQLLGRRDCRLCAEAERVLAQVLPEFHARLRVIDVDESPDLRRRYGSEVPVVLLDGRETFRHQVDPARLRKELASREQRRTT